jgi:hypothetical protein
MTRLGILGATALSLSLAIASPVLAQEAHNGGRASAHATVGGAGGGARMGGGAQMSGGPRVGAQANVGGNFATRGNTNFATRGNTNFAARGNANFAASGNERFAGGNARFAEGNRGALRGGEFRGERGRRFGRDAGFAVGAAAAGVATGGAIAAGGYDPYYYGDNYAYDSGYYGDSYAYDTGVTYDAGLPLVAFDQPAPVVEGPVVADASYCVQRYRSYDPASGTYLGFDGLRHPCP